MSSELASLLGEWSDEVEKQPVVYLNGRRCFISPDDSHLTLLEFLRGKSGFFFSNPNFAILFSKRSLGTT